MIMTRKAYARQEEAKLSLALSELKASKELCDQLIGERDDNERELLGLLEKNKNMKSEMAQLHIQYTEAIDARDGLQLIVDRFDQCSTEYELALYRIQSLEQQLYEANNKISQLECTQHNTTASLNQSLFSELVVHAPSMIYPVINTKPTVTIDLTGDNSKRVVKCSKNKLKKYVRINKFIRKTQKLVHRQKFFIKNVKLNRERLTLLDKLDMYSQKLKNYSLKYQNDTDNLNFQVNSLKEKLISMTNKYKSSEMQMKEYMLAMNELVGSCSCTLERSQSLTNNNLSNCQFSPARLTSACTTLLHQGDNTISETVSSPNNLTSVTAEPLNNCGKTQINNNNIVIFSDEIGKDMGRLLSNICNGQSVTNYCMPGLSYIEIVTKIINCSFSQDTTIIILISNRGNVNQKSLLHYYNKLCELNLRQIVMFTFPYSDRLPQKENNFRYKLNIMLNKLTSCESNCKFHMIDTNNYVSKYLYLTKYRLYLPIFIKRQLAVSLFYFIDTSAKNLATKTVASIEQFSDICIDPAKNLAKQVDMNLN